MPRPQNTTSSVVLKRRVETEVSTTSSSVRISDTGTVGSTSWTVAFTAEASAMGSPLVRTMSAIARGMKNVARPVCACGKYIVGSGVSVNPRARMSSTTPTTVMSGMFPFELPRRNRFPIASSPGHTRLAIAALTIATLGAPSRSAHVNSRPATSRMPIALKYPGVTCCGTATGWSPSMPGP